MSMNRIEAPALRGHDPVGFLAAVGVVALAEQGCIAPTRLSWEGNVASAAVFHSEAYATAEELAQALRQVAKALHEEGRAMPGVPPDFPYKSRHPNDQASGEDPMRMSREAARATYRAAADAWYEGEPWFARWLVSVLAMDATDNDKRVLLTPFNTSLHRMKFRDSYFDQALRHMLDKKKLPTAPLDAFVGWQRVPGYTGAYLEFRAIRDAAVSTDGESRNAGAPSPTWLAVMAIRMFPLAEIGGELRSAGWQSVAVDRDGTRRSFVWPIWRPPLDAPAIRTLLNHPALTVEAPELGDVRLAHAQDLAGLGLTAVFASSRRTRKGSDPLGPARRLWPA